MKRRNVLIIAALVDLLILVGLIFWFGLTKALVVMILLCVIGSIVGMIARR